MKFIMRNLLGLMFLVSDTIDSYNRSTNKVKSLICEAFGHKFEVPPNLPFMLVCKRCGRVNNHASNKS